MKILFWLIAALICVFATAQVQDTTEPSLVVSTPQTILLSTQTFKQKVSDRIQHVEKLVQNARSELIMNNNIRPSTEYTMDDIIFTFKKFLPSWIYHPSVWKQDVVTRRRNIARTVRSSHLIVRPKVVAVRDQVLDWTARSNVKFTTGYVIETVNNLESMIDSMLDFVAAATDKELMNPIFLSTGFLTLNNAITEFIKENNHEFDAITKQVNEDFNYIVAVSGKLRVPLESMREDAISQTKHIRDELFTKIEYGLQLLGHNIQADIQRLASEIVDVDQTTSDALRHHTLDSIQSEIQYFENVKLTLIKLKSVIGHVWENAANELAQSPTKIDYWIDVAAEVKEAFMELGRLLAVTARKYKRTNANCSCGWKNHKLLL